MNNNQSDKPDRAPGSLADMVAAAPALAPTGNWSGQTWRTIAVVAALFAAAHAWQFFLLFNRWRSDPNWSHGFMIPLFSLYLLYTRREELLAARPKACGWGLALVILAIVGELAAFFLFYTIGRDWIVQLSMVLLMLGLVLYLAGPRIALLAWVPVVFLAFSLPLPDQLYTRMALPLQNLAANVAGGALPLMGVEVTSSASKLMVTSVSGNTYPLMVAEACSGMRSLMAFLALSVAIAYLENRPVWQRVVLVTAAVPVAVFCNFIRVMITCGAFVLDKTQWGTGFLHEFTGMLMLIPAFVLLWLLGRLLRINLFVEVEEDDPADPDKPSQGLTV